MRIKVGNIWFKVIKETDVVLSSEQKHFEVEHFDDGGKRVTGLIPWWMVEECCNSDGEDSCGCSSCHSIFA